MIPSWLAYLAVVLLALIALVQLVAFQRRGQDIDRISNRVGAELRANQRHITEQIGLLGSAWERSFKLIMIDHEEQMHGGARTVINVQADDAESVARLLKGGEG